MSRSTSYQEVGHLGEVKEVDIVCDRSPNGYWELLICRDKLLRSDQRLHADGTRIAVWHLNAYGTTPWHRCNDADTADALHLHRYIVLKATNAVNLDLRI